MEEHPEVVRGSESEAVRPSTAEPSQEQRLDEWLSELGAGEAQLQLGSPEVSEGEDMQLQLFSRDMEELPLPPDPRVHRVERRQPQQRSARLLVRWEPHSS